jgi:chorismate mutase/prephenate dehydratase
MAPLDALQKLKKKRKKIDLIDRKLLNLLNQRLRIALEVGNIKKKMGEKIRNPRREQKVLEGVRLKNKGPLKDEDLKKIFETLIRVCRKSQV